MNRKSKKAPSTPGLVVLSGTGPGSYDLVTVGLLERLRHADAVVHDRLLPPELLLAIPEGAETVDVGKIPGNTPWPQEKINRLLVDLARRHRLVVRLKGGDPYIFGRGGEEAAVLSSEDIPYEILPGVSAFAAVPARFDIPVTHRGIASSACVITGHEDPTKSEEALDYAALACFPGTRVFFMGIRALPKIVKRLIEEGLDPLTPAAVLQEGYLRRVPAVHATIQDLPQAIKDAGIKAPALTVIGGVTTLPGLIRQIAPRYRLLFPRPFAEWARWRGEFSLLGIDLLPMPLIETEPLTNHARFKAITRKLNDFKHIIFTSANGVRHFFQRLGKSGLDLRQLAGIKFTVIGPGTADALAEHGLQADAIASRHVAEGVVDLFRDLPREPVLVARALQCRRTLVDELRKMGFPVEELKTYRTVMPALPKPVVERVRRGEFEGALFTAGSTLRNFLQMFDASLLQGKDVYSIGPETSKSLGRARIKIKKTAEDHSMPGILRMLEVLQRENPAEMEITMATKTGAKKTATTKPAAKKTATKKTAAVKPAAKKPAAKKPAAKKVTEKKPAVKKAAATKPAAKKPVVKKATTAKKPAVKKTAAAKPVAKKTAVKKATTAKKPVVKKAVAAKPVAKKTAVKKATTAKKPAVKKTAAAKPVAKKAAVKKPAVKKAAAAKPAAKKTAVKKTVARKPAAKTAKAKK